MLVGVGLAGLVAGARITVSAATDVAIVTSFGLHTLAGFEVISDEVMEPAEVARSA